MFGGGAEEEHKKLDNVAFGSSGVSPAPVDDKDADAFWAGERAWQKATLEREFLITVTDPQTVSGGMFSASYTTYLTTSSLCKEGVRRRYSDFDWLRDVLVARYHGVAIPLMPEKRAVGNTGAAFISERMAGLENFLFLLLANPFVREDSTVRMFLSQRTQAEFEQAKKATLQGLGADPASNGGLSRWYGVLRHLSLPVDADVACRELDAYCATTEAKLVACLSALTHYYDSAKRVSESLRVVRDSLADFHTTCAALSGSLSDTLAPVRVHTKTLGSRVQKGADAFSQAFDLSVFAPNEIQIFLLDGVISEIHRTRGLKTLLEVREHAQKAYSDAWVAQDKLNFQDKQFREKGRPDQAEKLAPKVAEAKATMVSMKERLDDISKGILHIEADRLAATRIERICAMTGQFAALCIASGVRGQELWTGFLGSMELSQEAMVRDAQGTLTAVTSMHSLDATGPSVAYVLPSARTAGAPRIAINSAAGAPSAFAISSSESGGFSVANPVGGGAGSGSPSSGAAAPAASAAGGDV